MHPTADSVAGVRKAEREDTPRFVPPMLCASGAAPAGDLWAFEVKWDGMRAQLRVDHREVCLRSRPGRPCGAEFPEVLEAGASIGARMIVLDWELVCFGQGGKPDFGALRRRLVATAWAGRPATYVAFDLLHLNGQPVRHLPYGEAARSSPT